MTGHELDTIILSTCGVEHTAHQVTRVSLGERTALSPRLCRQCRDTPLEGLYLVVGRSGTHFEPLCERCALFVVPQRKFMGVLVVDRVTLMARVSREGSQWSIG